MIKSIFVPYFVLFCGIIPCVDNAPYLTTFHIKRNEALNGSKIN
jgi:hypothetical protein